MNRALFSNNYKKVLLAMIILVIWDHLTKIISVKMLTEELTIIFPRIFCLTLYINPHSFSEIMVGNKSELINSDFLNKLVNVMLIPLFMVIYLSTKNKKKESRYLIALLSGVAFLIIGYLAVQPFENGKINEQLIVILITVLGGGFLTLFPLIVRDRYFQLMLLFSASGNVSNILSFLYPPNHVVDMLGAIPLDKVYNFADLYGMLGYLLLFSSPIYILIIWIKRVNQTDANIR